MELDDGCICEFDESHEGSYWPNPDCPVHGDESEEYE